MFRSMYCRQPKIGRKIKELRKFLQKDQGEFGKMLGLKQPIISQWENGARCPGSAGIQNLVKLAQHCTPPFPLGFEDFYRNGD